MENNLLSTTEYAVLGLLANGEESGYDLWQLAERSIAEEWRPARSQLYKILGRLEGGGLAKARLVRQTSRPDKRLYRLTATGEQVLTDWLEAVDEEPVPTDTTSLLKILFGRFTRRDIVAGHLQAYRRAIGAVAERTARTIEELKGRPEAAFEILTLRLEAARANASLAWADQTLGDLGKGPVRGAGTNRRRLTTPKDSGSQS